MAGNSFGQSFRITTAGESHGPGNVVIIDGVPPGIPLLEKDFLFDLSRRRPGQSKITTQRKEADTPEILSGVFEGKTTGTSLSILIRNQDQRSKDYEDIKDKYRPGHADFTFDAKYGFRDYRGGGRASARETVVRVAAGVVAKKILARAGVVVVGYVKQIGPLVATIPHPEKITLSEVESNIVRCPDVEMAPQMIALIDEVRKNVDSIGGVAEIVTKGIPAGWGEPVFDKLKADLAKGLFSLPAVMGVEYGEGFNVATLRGSENNDYFISKRGKITTQTNRHGGMLGGISSGLPLVLRCAIKPTSSLARPQPTVTRKGKKTTIQTKGRHDPCLLPRFIPMGEAMVAITLADHYLRYQSCRI
ncbi:MAG: chorismate synthase [Deltaproteobacteria bacterium RIFCSPLOWO2_12_FULL_40_28]|nr:MAG: chorismate synthase [Deltaproteobacteria bacterium RIFCSPHIGHO2_02_FULL_40_28]OGQ19971.1 MAG: chorismate synthase [Deltaproteobacteria bacterium RIFCSPHIGHO2_12_FULL_40_32]OGQ39731.1 MAG: chorismate synthase [Deltaproteobacteria bacterium RIFCSPLOWO2_02_FULL_40_36]OGQ52986.1 MAG: chorismate synthase [Deltaproteobacteria bacterium RIFCSPLOWO2_12_FULL_40_28]